MPAHADFKLLSRTPGSDTGELDEPESAAKRFKAEGAVSRGPSLRCLAKGAVSRGPNDRDAATLDMAGVYHTMEEHLELACALSCPADTSDRVPDQLRKNIFAMLTEGPVAISKKRMLALQSLNEQLAKLEATEKALRQRMHPDVESVTRGKALSLFRQLLEETKFPDLSILDLLEGGVPLVGQEAESPLFSKRPKPKEIEPEQLRTQAALRRQSLQRMKGLTSEQDYAAMKAETAEEVAAGFLTGPYHSEREVSDILQTDDWSLSPRFLLRQGEDSKIRIIDDFKMSAVNRAFGSSSFLELQDTDYAVGLLRFLSRVLQDRSKVRVPLADGSVLEGDWSREMLSRPALLGKTLDLSKAYRQVGIHIAAGMDDCTSSTRAYARVRSSTLEYARVRSSTHEYARVRSSTHEYARVRSSTLEYARVRSSTLEYARVRSSTHDYARVRSSTLEYPRVRTSTLEYARVRSSTLEYARVRSSALECARVLSSALECARVRSSTLEYAHWAAQTHCEDTLDRRRRIAKTHWVGEDALG